jgi:hypothetical protein
MRYRCDVNLPLCGSLSDSFERLPIAVPMRKRG